MKSWSFFFVCLLSFFFLSFFFFFFFLLLSFFMGLRAYADNEGPDQTAHQCTV